MLFEEVCQHLRSVGAHDVSGTDQTGDNSGQCRWGVTGGFFPALLLGDWSVTHQKSGGALHEREDVEVSQAVQLPKAPRQDEREGDLVELNAIPVGGSINPKVLCKTAVLLLRTGEVHKGPAGSVYAAAG